jgi:hypothetical protein
LSHPRRAARDPFKGQRWRPGEAGSAAFSVKTLRHGNALDCFSFNKKAAVLTAAFLWGNRLNHFSLISL